MRWSFTQFIGMQSFKDLSHTVSMKLLLKEAFTNFVEAKNSILCLAWSLCLTNMQCLNLTGQEIINKYKFSFSCLMPL